MATTDIDSETKLKQRVREELICAVCLDFLHEPKVLVCAHSFCLTCLVAVHAKRLHNNTSASDEKSLDENTLECPSCRQATPLPEGGVGGLQTHCKLANLVGIIPNEEKAEARKVIRQRRRQAEHSIADGTQALCKKHEKALEYYCEDCNELLCMRGMMDAHRDHHYEEAAKVFAEHIEYIRGMLQPALEVAGRAEAAMKQLEQDSESIQTNRSMSTESIREHFNKLRGALDKREGMLLATVNKYIDSKVAVVEQQHQKLQEKRSKIMELIDSLNKLLERTGDVRILNEEVNLEEEMDTEQDAVLDTESEVFQSMYSSSYVGFKDESVTSTERQISRVVTLLEFFPEADSGYYSSRKIMVDGEEPEEEESLYIDVRRDNTSQQQLRFGKAVRKQPSNASRKMDDDSESGSLISEESPQVFQRGLSQSSSVVEDFSPPVPIRFDSLLAPSPVVEPLSIFDKLSRSKTDSVFPCGVCVCMNDSLVVSDIKNNCLRIIASNGKFIDLIGEEGKGAGNFEEPTSLAVDAQQNILVTQRVNPRVQKFSPAGKFLQKFGQRSLLGSVLGEPIGIAVSPEKKIFVSDWEKSCIHIFQQSGKYAGAIATEKETKLGESVKFPAGITFNKEGRLLVADRDSHCVWILQQDGSPLGKFGSKGQGPGELYYPYGIAVSKEGNIIVTESGNNRISVFSPTGQFQRCFGRKGSEPGMFDHPRHICVNSKNELIVADENNQRVQVFSLKAK